MFSEFRRFFHPPDQEKEITDLLTKKMLIGDGADSTVYQSGNLALHEYKSRIKLHHLELLQRITQCAAEVAPTMQYIFREKPLRVHVVTIDKIVSHQGKFISICRFIHHPRIESIIGQAPLRTKFEDILEQVSDDFERLTGYKHIDIVPMNARYNGSQNELWITDLYSGLLNLRYYFSEE